MDLNMGSQNTDVVENAVFFGFLGELGMAVLESKVCVYPQLYIDCIADKVD